LLFGAGFVADVVAKAGHVLVLFDAPKPLSVAWIVGALSWHERAAYHVDTALVSLWPFGCCALAWWAFCGPKANGPDETEPPQSESYTGVDDGSDSRGSMALGPLAVKAILAAWLIFSLTMAFAFPLPKGWTAPTLHVVHITCAAVAGLAAMLGRRRRRERPAVVASYLLAGQLAVGLVGPFAKGAPWEPSGWDVARVGYTTLFLLLLVQHAAWLRPRR
jgi:hypothetical protein